MRTKQWTVYGIRLTLVIALMVGINQVGVQSQIKINKKPPKKDKPPACTTDGICDAFEYDPDKGLNDQPCPDCQPTPSAVLSINQDSMQLISNGGSGFLAGKIIQYRYEDGGFTNTWISQSFDETTVFSSIGDADNDHDKEILGLAKYYVSIRNPGKGRKTILGHNYRFIMYEDGCADGNPSWVSPLLGETTINMLDIQVADVDNNTVYDESGNILIPDFEIVLRSRYQIHVYDWNGQDFLWISSSPVHEQLIFSFSVGDADNDGLNEIIVPQFDTGLVYVYDYNGGDWAYKITPPVTATNPFGSPVKIDYARVGDADSDGKNEIVAGGNNYRLMIWKYDESSQGYNIEFVSDLLGGFTQGVDVGDLDNDGINEVVIGAEQSQTIFVFQFDGQSYNIVNSVSYGEGFLDLILGDLDNDGCDEIISSSNGIHIFDLLGGNVASGYLERTYFHPYGGADIEIK